VPSLRRMSGREVLSELQALAFAFHSQRGSHMKLRRTGPSGERQMLIVPDHAEMDTGTLRAIIRQASRFVAMEELHLRFYR